MLETTDPIDVPHPDAHAEVHNAVPDKKRRESELIAERTREFLQRGGRIRNAADDMDPDAEVSTDAFAQMLGATRVAVNTGTRNGFLFGARFPRPLRNPKYGDPVFRAGDVQRFLKERKS